MANKSDVLAVVDALPVEHRLVVHEFGYAIYKSLIQAGVTEPRRMRELVHSIWCGARGSTRRGKPQGFAGSGTVAQLDWLLIESGSEVSAVTLIRILRNSGLLIVPMEPSPPMVEASMQVVSGGNVVVSKQRKHAMRLRAAMDAALEHYWPFLAATEYCGSERRAGNDAR